MKRIIQTVFFTLFLLSSGTVFSQYGNIWYFGDFAGLDFNGGGIPTVLTDGKLDTDEGCASVCDQNGALLFYADGTRIWDKNHNLVYSSMLGNSSSTQAAVIVPRPGSNTNYFIFTMDAQYYNFANDGMYYTEVKVVSGVVSIVNPNVFMQDYQKCTEKIAVACHANGSDYWVTTLRRNGDFASWSVTSAGVSPVPVISPVTAIANPSGDGDDRVGAMKINAQGNRLVLGRRSNASDSEIFDYDNSTGEVTLNHGIYTSGVVYGVEFSANGDYFYISKGFNRVYMYDVSSLTPTLLHTKSGGNEQRVGALQMGPDGDIYVANGYEGDDGDYLDKISSVENGLPTYHNDFIALPAGHKSRLGLPDIVSCFVPVLSKDCEVYAGIDYQVENGCAYQFSDASTAGSGTTILSWQWDFGDGNTSAQQNPTHFYTTPGQYNVCLTVTGFDGEECCISSFCQLIDVEQICDEPCDIQHRFDWELTDNCGECAVNFNGILDYTNVPVLAWWYDFGDGNTAVGQQQTHSYTYNGTYNVCVTVIAAMPSPDGLGSDCCVFTHCETIQIDCAKDPPSDKRFGSLEADPSSSALDVFPNPSAGNIQLKRSFFTEQKLEIALYDLMGKVVWSKKNIQTSQKDWTYTIDVDAKPGIYLLTLKGKDFQDEKRVLIQ
ncbi:MAG: PKD domain-containing protein [Bacteroidota bacterium]